MERGGKMEVKMQLCLAPAEEEEEEEEKAPTVASCFDLRPRKI